MNTVRQIAGVSILLGLLGGATPAMALQTQWSKGLQDLNPDDGTNDTGTYLWTNAANWSAGVPANGVGDSIYFPILTSPVAIDTTNATLNLGNTAWTSVYNGMKVALYDSTYLTPVYNATPVPNTILPNILSFTPVAPYASLVEAANAAPALTLASWTSCAGTQTGIFHPLNVTGNMGNSSANYSWYCYGDVTVGGTMTPAGGHTFYSGLSAPGVMTVNNNYASITIHGVTTLGTVNQTYGPFTAEATSSGTITNLNITGTTFTDSSPSLKISNLSLSGTGIFVANNAGVMTNLPSSVTVGGGALKLAVAQNALPAMITVSAYGALAGDMTGAIYSGGSQNVTLNENAVFAGTGVVPTRADLGGAILYMGIANGSTGGPYVVGDDGSTSIYKGFAFGNAWTTSANLTKQLTAVGGDLAGFIAYAGLNNDTGNIWMGDGASHTANVKFSPVGYLNLKQSFNVGQSDPNLITTFNLSHLDAGSETVKILVFSATTGKILAGQTVNVDKGSIGTTSNLRNGGLLGTLTISNGVFANPGAVFTALDTGKLHFGDRAVVDLTNTGILDYLEALGAEDVTCSDRPIALFPGLNGQIVNLNLGVNQVLAKVLGSCDLIWSSYQDATLSSDAPVGHARFIYNNWDRTDGSRYLKASAGTEKITYAGNAPEGETPWIGFAATAQPLQIQLEVDAPAAVVQCGTDDPTRLVRPGAFTGVTANQALTFTNIVTAAGLRILSGSAAFSQDLSTGDLLIGAGTTLDANSKIFTISGTISGGGTAQECANLTFNTVAPGLTNACGNLTWSTANSFTMPADATYEWGMTSTNTAGVTYDLVTAVGKATFGGAWTLKLVNKDFTDSLNGSEVFKIIDGTSAAPVGFVEPTIIAPGSGFNVTDAHVYVDGYDVMLTGVKGPPTGMVFILK
jgi:hypothetical protein